MRLEQVDPEASVEHNAINNNTIIKSLLKYETELFCHNLKGKTRLQICLIFLTEQDIEAASELHSYDV